MLQDCANSHTPVKLQRFTKTTEGDKLIINDMVKITIPDQSEYCFQFKSMEQLVKMVTIKEILDLSDEWQIVSLCAKAIHVGEATVVGAKRLNLAQATFADVTGSILIDLWEDQIKLVEPGSVYRLTNLQVRVWAGEKKLSSTKESLFTSIANKDLQDVSVLQADVQSDVIKAITVPYIDLVKKVETSTHCCGCFRKLLQTTASKTARCDRCGSRMRLADCKKQLCADIVVSPSGGNPVILTVFQNVLETLITNLVKLNQDELSETLLSLENLKVTYNSKTLVVTELHCENL